MKFNSKIFKTCLLLFILCMTLPINTFEKSRSLVGLHKLNRAHSKSKFAHKRTQRSTFKSKHMMHLLSQVQSKTQSKTKDPVTLTIFAIVTIIKIASAVLDHYIQKNYRLTLQAMQQEYENNKNNAEILRRNEMRSCSSMQLLLRITKHLYLVAKFKLFYSERYLEIRKTQAGGEKIATMMKKISDVQSKIKEVYPQILKNIIANVKTVCEESVLGDDLIKRNQELEKKIEELEYKINSQESNMIMSIFDSVFSDMNEKKDELVGLQFKFESPDEEATPSEGDVVSFEKTWTQYTNLIKTGRDFVVLMGDIKEFYKNPDKDSVEWLKIISKMLTFLAGITSTTGNFIPDPNTGVLLSGISCIVTFVAQILDFIANIIDYRKEENLVIKKQKRKQLWGQVKTLLFQAGKCVASPVVEAIESTVNLVQKTFTLIESRKALEKERKDKAFYEKKGEIDIQISEKFQTFYQCEMRHFTVQLFYEVFKDALVLDQEITKEGGNAENAWKEILHSVSTRDNLKQNIQELCNENIQFCSRTFSEEKLIDIGFSDDELNIWKNEAINGPFTEIVVADSHESSESFIKLGYEPLHSFIYEKRGASVITVLGCRLCSKKYVIRWIDLFQSHRDAREAFSKNPDNIGECKSSTNNGSSLHICQQVFNGKVDTSSKHSPCNTRFKTIRFHPSSDKGVIGYEKVPYEELTSVSSSIFIIDSRNLNPNGSTSNTFEIHKNYSVWSKKSASFYDCSNYKNNIDASQEELFKSNFCSACTSKLYSTPKEKVGYLAIDSSDREGELRIIHKASSSNCNPAQIIKNMKTIHQYLSFKLQQSKSSNFSTKDTTNQKKLIGNSSDYGFFDEKRYNEYRETCRYDTYMVEYSSKTRGNERPEHILFQKDNYNWILPLFNEYVYRINKARLSKVSLKVTYIDEINNVRDQWNKEEFETEAQPLKFVVYSFKPFDTKDESESTVITNTQQSSEELCADICDENKNICTYHVKKAPTRLISTKKNIMTKEFSEFSDEKKGNHFKLSFKINSFNPEHCFKVGVRDPFLFIETDFCRGGSEVRETKMKDIDSTIVVVLVKKNDDSFMSSYRDKGYEMIITPDFNSKLSIVGKGDYYLRVLVKFLPSKGFIPFYDHFNSNLFTFKESCKTSLIKPEYVSMFWPEEFKNHFDDIDYKAGFAPLKMMHVSEHEGEELSIEKYINTEHSCKEYNIFLPKLFNKSLRPESDFKLYKKLIYEDNKIKEIFSNTGPGIHTEYWIQISNVESLFNNETLLDAAWKYNYVPLEQITSSDGNIMMRAWVSYNFEIFNDRQSLCDRCLKDKTN